MFERIHDSEFDEKVKEGDVVIDFGAQWCHWCGEMTKSINKIRKKFPSVKWFTIDTDDDCKQATKYEVDGLPTLLMFRDGKLKKKLEGYYPAEKLEPIMAKVFKPVKKKTSAK